MTGGDGGSTGVPAPCPSRPWLAPALLALTATPLTRPNAEQNEVVEVPPQHQIYSMLPEIVVGFQAEKGIVGELPWGCGEEAEMKGLERG